MFPATPKAIRAVIGHQWSDLYIPTPGVAEYGTVLVFPERTIVLSHQLERALAKHMVPGNAILAAADGFTVEAGLSPKTTCMVREVKR